MRIDGKIEVPDGAGERAVRDFYSYNSIKSFVALTRFTHPFSWIST